MGLFDNIKGIFASKTDEEKIAKWKEDGNSEKIADFTDESYEQALRLLAISALGEIKRDETAVNTCMKLILLFLMRNCSTLPFPPRSVHRDSFDHDSVKSKIGER